MECCDLPTQRERDICDGTAGIPLGGPHGRNAYRIKWGLPPIEAEGKPYKKEKPKQLTPESPHLVGDELQKLLEEYGLKSKSSCSCKTWRGRMNDWGIDGCTQQRGAIIDHLTEAYHSTSWWDVMKAGSKALFNSLPLTLSGILDEAIRRASKMGAFRPVDTDRPSRGERLIITVATGEQFGELLAITEPRMRAYAERIGADFVTLTNTTQSWWGLEKFRVHQYAKRYRRTLFIDADIIIRNSCPDLFEVVPIGSVGLHNDYPHLIHDHWLKTEWDAVMRSQGVPRVLPDRVCHNTGLVVCDDSTAHVWDAPPRRLPGAHCDEQLWIESTLATFGVPIYELDRSLNCQWWMRDFGSACEAAHVIHLANAPRGERLALARKFASESR